MRTRKSIYNAKEANTTFTPLIAREYQHSKQQISPLIKVMPIQRLATESHSLSSAEIMQLHRTIGNQAVGRLFNQQLKLPGSYEPQVTRSLPGSLKSGMETLSGLSLDDVKVHYNSIKPTQLKALAYTQGSDIHVAPGQEEHLPHEAWHVIQQKQGRVQPTMYLKGTAINNDSLLEQEAEAIGKNIVGHKAKTLAKKLNSKSVEIGHPGSFQRENSDLNSAYRKDLASKSASDKNWQARTISTQGMGQRVIQRLELTEEQWKHISLGELKDPSKAPKLVGYHWTGSNKAVAEKAGTGKKGPNTLGVYEEDVQTKVEYGQGKDKKKIKKAKASSFWPDKWTEAEIKDVIAAVGSPRNNIGEVSNKTSKKEAVGMKIFVNPDSRFPEYIPDEADDAGKKKRRGK